MQRVTGLRSGTACGDMSQSSIVQAAQVVPVLSEVDDVVLAGRAQRGEERAFAELLRRHRDVMTRTAMRRTQNAADAEDVVQDTALKAWQSLATLRDPARIRPWLLQITDRRALTLVVLRRQEHELAEESAWVAGPDHGVERFDLQDGVRTALQDMPRMQARAWLLREVDELSYRQIAERLGASESTVRGWLVLARRRVQRGVEQCCPNARPVAAPMKGLPVGSVAAPPVPPVKSAVATYPPAEVEDARPVAGLRSPLHRDLALSTASDSSDVMEAVGD